MSRADVVARLAAQIAAVEGRPARSTAEEDGRAALPEGGAAALAFLVRSTARRPLTTAEARDKLVAREHPEDVADAVVAHATAEGILDDEAFAVAWVEDRGVKRGYGRARLARELRRRRIEEPIVDRALARLDAVDEVAQATELARARAQRMPADDDPARVAQRLVGMLVRRGFPGDVAHRVAREVTALDRDWD